MFMLYHKTEEIIKLSEKLIRIKYCRMSPLDTKSYKIFP